MARSPGFRSAPHGAVRSPSATVGPRVLPVGFYFYCQSHQVLKNLKSQDFKKNLCKKFFQKLKFEHPENPLCNIEKQQAKKIFYNRRPAKVWDKRKKTKGLKIKDE